MSDKYFVSVTPNSGAGKSGKDWPSIKQTLEQAGLEFDYALSTQHRENIEHVQHVLHITIDKICRDNDGSSLGK